MKIFAVVSSIFCLYFFYSPELKADQLESSSQILSQDYGSDCEVGKCPFYPCINTQELQIVSPQRQTVETTKYFSFIDSRDLHIHTGLSPPLLFS